jgi:RimJ/RimL family protein N-acetyltransferase
MISLRKITGTEYSSDLLVKWRNADFEFFGDGKTLLTRESHYHWYRYVYVNDPRDHMYFVMQDHSPVGTIAAILGKEGTEISRVLLGDKGRAQQGVMSEALSLLRDIYPGPYWLRVKPGNSSAIRFYQKNGFILTGKTDDALVMSRS